MLQSLGLILLCGLAIASIFKKLHLPGLIGMLLTGILLGPYVFNLIDSSILNISSDLRQIALIIILIRAGLSLDFTELKKIGRPAILMSFLPAVFEITATFLIAPIIFNINHLEALLLGAVIASASPAVIVPRMVKLIENKYGTNKYIPQMILAGDAIDDVFNILIFTILLGIHTTGNMNSSDILNLPISIFLGIILGLLTGFILSFFFNKYTINTTVKVIMILSISISMISLESYIPISSLLAVMVNGIVIYKKLPKEALKLSKQFNGLWIFAEIILFVLVGASVEINYALNYTLKAVILLIIIISIRALGIFIALINSKLNKKEKIFTMITGIPKATVQAAIGSIPLAMGLPSGELILSISVVTILLTAPLGAILIDLTYKKLLSKEKSNDNVYDS